MAHTENALSAGLVPNGRARSYLHAGACAVRRHEVHGHHGQASSARSTTLDEKAAEVIEVVRVQGE